jgi:hypothetical protein
MNPRRLNQAMAVALLFGAACLASAQTSSSDKSADAGTHASASASAKADTGSKHAKSGMRHAHAKMHAHERSAKAGDTPYHAALKQCVEGPSGQRDNCIDQAISQYGRS